MFCLILIYFIYNHMALTAIYGFQGNFDELSEKC